MDLNRLTVQALRSEYQNEVGFELALLKTQDNGIDEIFFEHQGLKYVAFDADNVDIANIDQARRGASWNGQPVQVLQVNDEHNHWQEKTWNTTKNIMREAIPDGIGGAAGAALVIKVGLKRDLVKTAAVIGFLASFAKSAISEGWMTSQAYKEPDWQNLKRFTTDKPAAATVPSEAARPLGRTQLSVLPGAGAAIIVPFAAPPQPVQPAAVMPVASPNHVRSVLYSQTIGVTPGSCQRLGQ